MGYIPHGCQARPKSARPIEDLSKSNYLEFLAFISRTRLIQVLNLPNWNLNSQTDIHEKHMSMPYHNFLSPAWSFLEHGMWNIIAKNQEHQHWKKPKQNPFFYALYGAQAPLISEGWRSHDQHQRRLQASAPYCSSVQPFITFTLNALHL